MDALRFIAAAVTITAAVWMLVLQRTLAVPTDVEDALNAVAYLVLGGVILVQAARTPTQTRRVRDGWIGRTLVIGFRRFEGTHEQFVARFRRGLSGWGWTCVVLGPIWAAGLAIIIVVPDVRRDPMLYPLSAATGVFFGLALMTVGVVYLRCRRILDSPRQGPAPAPGQHAASG